MSLAIEKC